MGIAAFVAGVAVESLAVTIPLAVMFENVTLLVAPSSKLVRDVAAAVEPPKKGNEIALSSFV